MLVDIDEKSYEGGTNGDHHPMSWYHDFDGGRAWYTNMGHTEATFSEPLFLQHLLGGLRYAMGTGTIDYSRARPEENRFTKVVLAEKLDEPVELAVLPGERVLFVERHGDVNLYSPTTKAREDASRRSRSAPNTRTAVRRRTACSGSRPIRTSRRTAGSTCTTRPPDREPKNVLARFTMKGDSLDLSSQKIILEVPVQRDKCCHTGGSIAFDGKGNLFSPPATTRIRSPPATRRSTSARDACRGTRRSRPANTNDLRGKIIRIHPEPDGTYTIPEGNLFPKGTAKTRPEIYTMGHRNPYRISVDSHTGFLYWGDVGPDAKVDSVGRGPRGLRRNRTRRAGRATTAGRTSSATTRRTTRRLHRLGDVTAGAVRPGASGQRLAEQHRPHRAAAGAEARSSGIRTAPSPDFPLVGTGGRTAMAGPVFYRDDFRGAARPFPQYYDGKLFIYEWMRGWIMAVTMDAKGDLVSIERFMPSTKFSNPIDMEFGPSGDLYMLEYGTGWFQGNDDARLVRIEYNAGNRKPIVAAAVDQPAGALPLRGRAFVGGHGGPRRGLAAIRVDDHAPRRRRGAAS